jgi:hypothetical protein
MALPSNGPQQPCTVAQIQDWVSATKRKRLELHLLAAEPLYNTRREWAFMEMSKLLIEAIEEVRVINAELREESQQLRARLVELQEESSRLQECSRRYEL